jgi:F0F1-type ATP synthase delta subunit
MKVDPLLIKEFQKQLEESQHRLSQKVYITSTYRLEPVEIERIIRAFPLLKGREYVNEVDRSILGGLVIRFGSKIIDLSIKETLDTFLKQIYEIN